ncbi:uncharacterized protein VTP21DRAFT_10884 [Calcarisporiella thermophila]|uniref:uncharacterized protein n=1 Tax=Calcarisporiella thermophila TaxID=911321 RepID=UPI0037422C6B
MADYFSHEGFSSRATSPDASEERDPLLEAHRHSPPQRRSTYSGSRLHSSNSSNRDEPFLDPAITSSRTSHRSGSKSRSSSSNNIARASSNNDVPHASSHFIPSHLNDRQSLLIDVGINEADSEFPGSDAEPLSRRESVENDVCFPGVEGNRRGIDYDALEEYISLERSEFGESPASVRREMGSPYIAGRKKQNLYGETTDKAADTPFRFTFYSTATSTVHARSLHEIPSSGTSLSEMLQAGCFWLDILSPTDDEMTAFGRIFRIHPLTIEDILMEEAREKCDVFKNYNFVCFQSYESDHYAPDYLQPVNMYMIVMKEGILTVHFRSIQHPANVRRRIKILKDYIDVTPEWINYALLDDITDSFAPIIRSIEFEVDSIDELVLILKESEQSDMLRRIGYARKKMMGMLRLLGNKTDVLRGLIKRCENPEVALYLGDVQDHILTMVQSLSHYEKISSRSHSNYLAQISIDATMNSNDTNDMLTKLTALGSVILPMNLVTGLWGMNVRVPGEGRDDLTYFFALLSFMLVFALLLTLLLKNLRLL